MSTVLGGVAKLLESISSGRRKLGLPKESLANERHAQQLLHPSGLSVPELKSKRVRVVVFKDEKGAKQPIFDSQQITNNEEEEPCTRSLCDMRHGDHLEGSLSTSSSVTGSGVTGSSTHSAGWATASSKSRRGFLVKRPSTDSELLGEMMFGSMPMKVIGDTVKVHYIRSTDQLMLSKVFTTQRKVFAQCSLTDFTDSCPLSSESPHARSMERSYSAGPKPRSLRQISPDATRPQSSTLSVPIKSSHLFNSSSPTSSAAASPFLTSSSNHSPPSPLNSLAVPSLSSSLSRRIQRSRSTSLENASELYRKVLKPLDQHSNGHTRKRRKYSIGVIICLSELSKTDIRLFQSFIFSHFTLIDAHLERLRLGVEEACSNRSQSVVESTITRAYETFLEDFLSLYTAPRIESPAWLSLVSHVDRRKEVCIQFMEELASAIVELDTKETKFFLSSLLTAVLSHHLAWVYTVSHTHQGSSTTPSDPASSGGGGAGSNRHGKTKSLGVLAESHPYNPLWAQLGDLFGSVSNPLKVSRTVVTGQSAYTVSRLLYLLTYFIRCSEVQPGFTTEMSPSPSSPMPAPTSRSEEVRIPTSSASSTTAATVGSTPSYDVSQLDENPDVFGSSRASSVTVMSEHDRHSLLLSPYASPVNHQDTPIIRTLTHPFGIGSSSSQQRTTPLSQVVSPDTRVAGRAGSQSESDSIDSFNLNLRGSETSMLSSGSGGRYLKKQAAVGNQLLDMLPNSSLQSTAATLKKNSPLLSSSRQTGTTGFVQHAASTYPSDKPGLPTSASCHAPSMENHTHTGCNCHYGNPTTCATIACCESMGMCPLEDGFVTFNPSRKYTRSGVMSVGVEPHCHTHFYVDSNKDSIREEDFNEFSLSHLASRGLLGPTPSSLDSTHCSSVVAPPPSSLSQSHTACSSLDSGYDQSLSLTNSSSRDSMPEYLAGNVIMVRAPFAHGHGGVAVGRCGGCGSDDSGCGCQCICGNTREKGCRRNLFPQQDVSNTDLSSYYSSTGNVGMAGTPKATPTTSMSTATDSRLAQNLTPASPMVSVHQPQVAHAHPVSHNHPDRAYEVVKITPPPNSSPSTLNKQDPTNSLFPITPTNNLSRAASSEELSSPLMPEPLRATSSLVGEAKPRLSDSLKSLPGARKFKHIRTIADSKAAKARRNNVNAASSDFMGLDLSHTPSSSVGHAHSGRSEDENSLASVNLSVALSSNDADSIHTLGSSYNTSSVPVTRSPHVTPTSSLVPASASLQPPSKTTKSPTECCPSEADSGRGTCCESGCDTGYESGRGTKENPMFAADDFNSLPHISEMSFSEPGSDCGQDSLSIPFYNQQQRASSTPPTLPGGSPHLARSKPINLEDGVCPVGGAHHASFTSLPQQYCDPRSGRCQNGTFPDSKVRFDSSKNQLVQTDRSSTSYMADRLPLTSLKAYRNNPSALHQRLHEHDQSLVTGARPSTLEQFDNFTDVPLPNLDEFHLDMSTAAGGRGVRRGVAETGAGREDVVSHRQWMSDFGHSLFVGLSPRYLPDFVLHGTNETANQAFQEKLSKDLAHMVKYSIIDEPVEYGVGIVADTDSWSVKVLAASKSVQTSDVIFGAGQVVAAKCVRQMLSSVRSMHCMRMPPEFCLSFVEDCLLSVNERSTMLASSLLEKGGDVDLTEDLNRITENLSIPPTDVPLLLPVAAVNCPDPDLAWRLNHLYMQKTLGKYFV